MNDLDKLRKEYPHMSETVLYLMADRRELRDQLGALRGGLAWLVGYHDRDGAVPVAVLERLLAGEEVIR